MANFGPITYLGADASGKVLDLRTPDPGGLSLDTNYNQTSWLKFRVDGAGAEFTLAFSNVAPGGTVPIAPVATLVSTTPGQSLHIASGGEITIGIPNSFGYDAAGNRAPPQSLASHLRIWCITAGTAAALTVQGG